MKIHIVCTTNGQLNEGMNNIEAHYAARFAQGNMVTQSSLKDIAGLIRGAMTADCVLLFTRALKRTYCIAWLACLLNKHVWFIVVQKPDDAFIRKVKKQPLSCGYLYLSEDDIGDIRVHTGKSTYPISVGLNTGKFVPVSSEQALALKKKYGFTSGKPLVAHVGHCSAGRGVEDFLKIDSATYDCLFVDSGIFDNQELKDTLTVNGVRLISGYIENVNEVYQMADAYFFPTKSGDYVISVPLSIMEALACGTAAVAYRSFQKTDAIQCASPDAILKVDNADALNNALATAVKLKAEKSYLREPMTWDEAANQCLAKIKE